MLYFEDFFEAPPLDDVVDLRADDFSLDFFAPLFAPELEREALDFFAPDFSLDRDEPALEALFDAVFLLVAGDLAIADILSFPSKKGTGIASPAVVKKPPSDCLRLIARNRS